ncbi:MAG: hypothetical protein ACLQNE_32940 [Thermoguttaceae bacterium]
MLNRTTRTANLPAAERPNRQTAGQWADFEKTSAEGARKLAETLERLLGKPFPMLFDAEKEMLAAGGELSEGRFPPAVPHDKDALTNLIKARNTVRLALADPPPGCKEFLRFDRIQAQKLRRPKEMDEKKEAEKLPDRLRELAKREEFVYATIKNPLPIKSPPDVEPSDDGENDPAQTSAKAKQLPQKLDKKEGKKESERKIAEKKNSEKQEGPEARTREENGQGKERASPGKDNAGEEGGPKEGAKEGDRVAQAEAKEGSKEGATTVGHGKGGGRGRETTLDGDGEKDIQKMQSDVAVEARTIEQTMGRIAAQKEGGLSKLALTRMNAAAQKAEEASGAFDRGNRGQAAGSAREAAGMFTELAIHVEGLLGRQSAQRLASARDLAGSLARRERELADRLAPRPQPGPVSSSSASSGEAKRPKDSRAGGRTPDGKDSQKDGQGDTEAKTSGRSNAGEEGQSPESLGKKGPAGTRGTAEGEDAEKGQAQGNGGDGQSSAQIADQAGRLTESARTLDDLLHLAGQAEDKNTISPETLAKIEKLFAETDSAEAILRMQKVEQAIRSGQGAQGRAETLEIAQRVETIAERLDVLHRAVVAPRVEALVALEKRAAGLLERLQKLDSQAAISDWHRQTDQLLQDLGKQRISDQEVARLAEAMRGQGWGGDVERWNWARIGGYYYGPTAYVEVLRRITVELQEQAREMVLRELISADEEATPPQYKELVERYFQILSQRASHGTGKRTATGPGP